MKLLEPEFNNFHKTFSRLASTGDMASMIEAQNQLKELRIKHGITHTPTFFTLLQAPFLITWFLCLREMSNQPDKFPDLKTDGFLWFQNLADYDPYCLLPLASSIISFCNLSLSGMNTVPGTPPGAESMMKKLKYLPFISLPIVVFFPACINIYWAVNATVHLSVSLLIRSKTFKRIAGIPQYLPGSILERMYQQKQAGLKKSPAITVDDLAAEARAKAAVIFFFQAEDGIRDRSPSRGLGDVYKRQLNIYMDTIYIHIHVHE
eukprot:TRINITY_DN5550_c0_g1_i4.p2 TRINITY_DN5550_c0_g1~~TRINITY_DN5550_c0_g1_i4.p2  ORF type:complete len:263 (-),score=53.23 TRINITY_DN5550_c0_g1_i4:1136-1924(-)